MAEATRASLLGSATEGAPRTLAEGERIAERYEVRRLMARGGMGEVYEAFDSELGEAVALKTLVITAVDRADAVKRFLAEVRLARKVTHPQVCRILEFGIHQRAGALGERVPFLTMPLLQGETLAARLARNGRLSTDEAWRILNDLAAGLGAVHAAGVVHRDFKSDNVFLARSHGGSERVLVMDFGLARAHEGQAGALASTGRFLLGTPAYMAPEQLEGKAATPATDVYALGVVAFEMITGRLPFVGHSPTVVALARLSGTFMAPSSLVPGLGRGWDLFISRCLERDPRRRLAGMRDVMAELERLRAGGYRRPRRRAATLAAALAALAVVAGGALIRPRVIRAPTRRASNSTPSPGLVPVASVGVVAPPPLKQPSPGLAAPPVLAHRKREPRARRAGSVEPAGPAPAPAAPPEPVPAIDPLSSEEAPKPPRPRHPDDLVDPFDRPPRSQ